MWWAGSEAAQVYLGPASVGVWSPASSDAGVQWRSAASAQEGWAQGIELLLQLEPRPRRRRVAVWLSGTLARPFIFEPVQGLRRWSEALQVAAGLAPEATGLDGPCEVWLDGWAPGKPCIAIAIDGGLRDAIESLARSRNVRLTALRPWWVAALNEAVRKEAVTMRLLAVEEPDALTVLCGADAGSTAAASYAPRPDPAQTDALLTRALLAANVSAADGLRATIQDSTPDRDGVVDVWTAPFDVRLERLA